MILSVRVLPKNSEVGKLIFLALLSITSGYLFHGTRASAGAVTFVDLIPIKTIKVEEASTPVDRARGLMYRGFLAKDSGMIFIFDEDKPLHFWMKNVVIDLDIIFLDKNLVIRKIHHSATPCVEPPCKTYGSGFAARYALEVSGRFCEKYGVKELQRIEYRK